MRYLSAISASLLFAISVLFNPLMAQGTAAPAQQTQYSDVQLSKFANASEKVAAVVQEYNPKVQSTNDEDKRQQLLEEADKKMVASVQDEGLTVEEFNGINQAIQQDPQVLERMQRLSK